MNIRHVTIQNPEEKHNFNKVSGFEAAYAVHFNLSYKPDKMWRHYFYRQWQKLFMKKKRSRIVGNEIRLLLEKNEDIQSYIECVKNLINYTNTAINAQSGKGELEVI